MKTAQTFAEYLFAHVPMAVTEGTMREDDPVAKLSRRHQHDIDWPVDSWPNDPAMKQRVLNHMVKWAWSRFAAFPATLVKDSLDRNDSVGMTAALENGARNVVQEIFSIRRTLELAWADYVAQLEEQAQA